MTDDHNVGSIPAKSRVPERANALQNRASSSFPLKPCRGFSLIEMVLIFALLGVATVMTVISFDGLSESGDSEPPERTALHAIRKARIAAINEQAWTYLSWNKETRAFDISTLESGVVESIEVQRSVPIEQDNLEIRFRSVPPEFEGNAPFAFRQSEDVELERVTFSPQRVSTPFILEVEDGDIEYSRTIDPFSSLPIEPEEER